MIPIIKQALLENLSTDNLGPIKLRSAFGQSVEAHLVCLDVRLADSSGFPFLPLTFAVVKELTEDVILPESRVGDLRGYTHMREVKIETATRPRVCCRVRVMFHINVGICTLMITMKTMKLIILVLMVILMMVILMILMIPVSFLVMMMVMKMLKPCH